MSAKTIMIVCVALFAVVHSMPASKQAAPAEGMKTAETIYRSWAPSDLLGYRSAYTLPSVALGYGSAYTIPSAALGYHSAYNMPYAYRSAAAPTFHSAWNYESPIAYSSILDADCL